MGFVHFAQLTILDVVGQDAARVLNNVCTAPVLQLIAGDGLEGFITEVRGRTLGHVCIYRLADRMRLIGPPGQAAVIAAHLDRYTIREDAVSEDHSDCWAGLLAAEDDLRRVNGSFTLAAPLTLPSLPWRQFAATDPRYQELAVYRVPWTGDGRVLVAGPVAALDALVQQLGELGADAEDQAAFHHARVTNRFPWFGIDLDDRNLPQEADRDALAISFTKGCYLGQETIARLDALGQVQKKLVLWQIEASQRPAAGTELSSEGRTVGRLSTVVDHVKRGRYLALGFARRSHFDAGATAQAKTAEDQMISAVVV